MIPVGIHYLKIGIIGKHDRVAKGFMLQYVIPHVVPPLI
jgi:hypothetical protein